MADTRKDRRAPISLKVRFKSATVDEFIEQYAKDISRGGIYIKSKKPMAVGTLLKFEFQLKDESRLIHGVGRVVWKREDQDASGDQAPPGMGIKFIKMDPQSRAMVETIVESRGAELGTFDGHETAAPTQRPAAGAAPFFPSTTPKSELPKPEDRTQIRHATEFLASALSEADEESAKEAADRAEEARERSEEIQRERDAAEARRIAEEEAAAQPEPAQPETAERTSDEPAAISDAEREASEAAFAAMDAALEEAAREAEGVGEALGRDPVDPLAATIAAEPSSAPPPASSDEARDSEPAAGPSVSSRPPRSSSEGARSGPALPEDDDGQTQEPKRSVALPIGIAIAAAAGIGLIAWPMFNKQTAAETLEPTTSAIEPPSIAAEPAPVEPEAPAVETADLEIVTSPEGADIAIDGERVAQSPSVIQVPVGQEVTVAISRRGFREATQAVTGGAEMEPSLAFELEPMDYVVLVETTPSGARVRGIGRPALAPAELALRNPASEPITLTATRVRHQQSTATVDVGDFSEEEGRMVARVQIELAPASRPPRRPRPPAAPREPVASDANAEPTAATPPGSSAPPTDSPPEAAPVAPEAPPAEAPVQAPTAPIEPVAQPEPAPAPAVAPPEAAAPPPAAATEPE